jgi:hypothetical protein
MPLRDNLMVPRILGALAFSTVLSTSAGYAQADALPPAAERTVAWYVAHSDFREKMRRACIDNPGRAALDRDCINSHYADMEVITRQQEKMTGAPDMLPRLIHPLTQSLRYHRYLAGSRGT